MKAKVDQEACIGCGLCVATCPAVFAMGGDKAIIVATPVPRDAETDCKKATEECPVTAIVLG